MKGTHRFGIFMMFSCLFVLQVSDDRSHRSETAFLTCLICYFAGLLCMASGDD